MLARRRIFARRLHVGRRLRRAMRYERRQAPIRHDPPPWAVAFQDQILESVVERQQITRALDLEHGAAEREPNRGTGLRKRPDMDDAFRLRRIGRRWRGADPRMTERCAL